jgi:hypothetical protein
VCSCDRNMMPGRPLFARFLTVSLLLAGLASAAGAQDVSVRGSVSEATVGTEETVTFTLEVEGVTFSDVEMPEPPETEGLVLVTPIPSTQRNMTFINGQLRQSVGFSWSFRPVREGGARIGAARVTAKGKAYETRPISVQVVAQGQRPQRRPRSAFPSLAPPPDARQPDGEAPAVDERDLFIKVVTSKRQALQNEQVTLEYLLYFRDGIQLRHSRLAGSWDAEGFWREEFDVETRPIPRAVVENGLRYNVITLKRVAVFPARAGTLRIDPLQIETEAYVPYRSGDPFDQFFSLRNRFDTIELASPAVSVEASPLPAGAPAGYGGAVGSYRMTARVSRSTVEVGEPVEVEVTITGAGNLATLPAPPLPAPGVFEAYDPQVNATITRTGALIQGTKTFTYVLVPRSNGTFALPDMAFAFFDPARRQYETLRAPLATIRVTGTATTPATATETASGLPVDDIAGLLPAGRWMAPAGTPLHRQTWPYAALAAPLVLLAALYAYRRHATRLATDTRYARNRVAHPLARKHLKQAEALLRQGHHRAFFEELERAVLGFIGNRFNVAEQGLTRPQLDARLATLDVAAETRQELRALLEACDLARFSPVVPERAEMEHARDRAARLIVALDQAATRQAAPVG